MCLTQLELQHYMEEAVILQEFQCCCDCPLIWSGEIMCVQRLDFIRHPPTHTLVLTPTPTHSHSQAGIWIVIVFLPLSTLSYGVHLIQLNSFFLWVEWKMFSEKQEHIPQENSPMNSCFSRFCNICR